MSCAVRVGCVMVRKNAFSRRSRRLGRKLKAMQALESEIIS